MNEKGDGPYRGFGYLSLFSDPIDLATLQPKRITDFLLELLKEASKGCFGLTDFLIL